LNVKVYVVSTAEGLLKLNSNTAGLPSVAEAGVIGYSWSRIIIIDCSSSRSCSRGNVKSSLFSINRISSCWYTHGSRSSTRRYGYCLRSGSVISTPAVPLVNVKYSLLNSRRVTQAEFKHSRTSFSSRISDCGYSGASIIIIDCSSSRSSSRGNSKGLIDSAIVSAVVGTLTSRSSTRRYSYCLRSGSVISTSSSIE
jgi:hypothetical protein